MKILLDSHLLGKNRAGMERYWKNLAKYLEKSNEINSLYLYSNASAFKSIRNKALSCRPNYNNGFLRIIFGFNKVINKYKPDIFHANFFSPIFKRCPTVTTVHDLCFITNSELFPPFFKYFASFWIKKTLYDSDAIICVSDVVKKQLIRLFHLPECRIKTIYSAPDPIFKKVKNTLEIHKTLKKFGIKKNYILIAGDLDNRGRSSLILDSFSELVKEYKNIELVITGRNKMTQRLAPTIKGFISILDYINDYDLNKLYSGAKFVIYFSKCEGFGFPIIESMVCGTPVICNDLEVFREIALNGAIFVKNKNELVHAMKRLLIDPIFRSKYVKRGYRRARFFSWYKTAKETLGVYRSILNNVKIVS